MNQEYIPKMFGLLLALGFIGSVWSHARLMEPPSRSSMWRFGYETPKNYDDDGLYCGGMNTHWKQNGGKCGVCGDPWHVPTPRPNEVGGKYGNGIIVRTYKPGQVIQAVVDITANHRGHFEFRICANKNRKKEVTQECLDQNLLTIINGTSTRYEVAEHGRSRVHLALQLPKRFTCKYCVFQWTYVAGNNWGRCKNGSFALGCGSQETFKSCADVSVTEHATAHVTPATSAKPATASWQGSTKKISFTTKPTTPSWQGSTKKISFTTKPTTPSWQGSTKKIRSTVKPTTLSPGKDKKKLPPFRPHVLRGETYQEAINRLMQDPRLRWMVKPMKIYPNNAF